MLFNTFSFFGFIVGVLLLHKLLPRSKKNLWLLISSYVFYAFWDWRFTSLLLFSTCVDFYCGKKIYHSESLKIKNRYLALSILSNLGILAFFKYYNFFIDSASTLMTAMGMTPNYATLNVILPVGISFYTFQTLSYSIDISRKQLKPATSFIDFSLFVSFFPQLVAGPIERAKHLLPQIENHRPIGTNDIKSGLWLILRGYSKKVLISDNLTGIVDHAFANAGSARSIDLWIGLVGFSVQIYLDFSGYTDIARGISRLFGFNLMKNFNQPYLFSKNIAEFWKRWHISLSTWLRDYLYIPLGGNRRGNLLTYRNLSITMLLGGLWHGASWNFVIWGGLHGFYLCIHRLYTSKKTGKSSESSGLLNNISSIVFVYLLVLITWIPFRANGIENSYWYFIGLINFSGSVLGADILLLSCILGALVFFDYTESNTRFQNAFRNLPLSVKCPFVAFTCSAILLSMYDKINKEVPFIYFQF